MAVKIAPRKVATDGRFAMRALWRYGAWGSVAALALAAVAIASQNETGSRRLAVALAPVDLPVRPVATVKVPPPANDAETRRLAAQVEALSADRDRLSARLASLERQLDDMTGSIKRLAERPVPAKNPPALNSPATAPPLISPLAMPDLGGPASWSRPQPKAETSEPDPAAAGAAEPAEPPAPEAMAPALEKVPLPPVRIASAEPGKPEFGIALAGATSLELTRIQWSMLQTNFGPMLTGLQPRALTERRGNATHYRLLAGPLPTYTAAAKLCARMIAAHATCRPVKFAGDPL